MFPQILRPSTKRWYAELVRKTNNNPRALTIKECAVDGIHMAAAASGLITWSFLCNNAKKVDQDVIKITGPRTDFKISELGRLHVL